MIKENGEIVCNKCGKSLGERITTVNIHYCTSCSFDVGRSNKTLGFAGNNCNYMG